MIKQDDYALEVEDIMPFDVCEMDDREQQTEKTDIKEMNGEQMKK